MRFIGPATGGQPVAGSPFVGGSPEKPLYLRRNQDKRLRVSLNRYEQMLLDYVHEHPDETDFWRNQVTALRESYPEHTRRVEELNRMLWSYYAERGRHVPRFATVFSREGRATISMRNLAEYLIERWSPPRGRTL